MGVYKQSATAAAAKAKKFHALYYYIVTFKDLQKLVQSQQSGPGDNQVLQRLKDKGTIAVKKVINKQTVASSISLDYL